MQTKQKFINPRAGLVTALCLLAMTAPLFLAWPAPVSVETQPTGAALIAACRAAARAEKEDDALRRLDEARQLLTPGAAVNGRGEQGRTALHWLALGAGAASKEKLRQAWFELTETLLARGAEVNAEDDYGNTALDYEEAVSGGGPLLALLLDHGARHGAGQDEAARLGKLLDAATAAARAGDLDAVRAALQADVPLGARLEVRLTTAVGSRTSRNGDAVEAVVIAPVLAGEREVIAPGTKLEGTVMLARKAPNDYQRAQLVVDFANLVEASGARTPLLTRVLAVDNARETIEQGRIIGVPHPNESKLNWAARVLGFTNPLLADGLKAAVFVRDRELKREIEYPPGVEITLALLAPVKLAASPVAQTGAAQAAAPPRASPELTALVRAQPMRTETGGGTPSDVTNLLFIGARAQLEAAFRAAGWTEAEETSLKSGLKTFVAVLEERGYKSGPVSLLTLGGARPAFAYQKQNNTFAKRHHIRFWPRPETYEGQPVWVAAATHDIGIAVHREGTQWIHRIDSSVDRERAKVTNDLLFTGLVKAQTLIDRPAAPRTSENATGDKLETDGRMQVLILR